MSDVDGFLSSLKAAYSADDHYGIADHLDPLDDQRTSILRDNLNAAPHLRASSYTSLTKSFFGENPTFAELVASYLIFVRDAHSMQDIQDEDEESQAAAAVNTFELFSSTYNLAITVLASQESAWFVPILRKLANGLATFAHQADALSQDNKNTHSSTAARLLTRSLGISAGDRTGEWPSKRNAVFFLANHTFRIYFRLNNLRLCDTVVSNTRDARDFLDSQYPKSDRVTFRYYLGRMYLYQRRMRKAMLELRKAFALCTNGSYQNKRLLFIYLTTASLPLGICPKPALLEYFDLQEVYQPLIDAVKVGNYKACLAHLDAWQHWHLKKGTYLVLREKLEAICWRNLARRTMFIANASKPIQQSTGPPTLKLQSFLTAAKLAFNDELLDLEDIEAMCASLLDQGYLKAYIHQAMQLLVLQRGESMGFPPVSTVRMIGDEA